MEQISIGGIGRVGSKTKAIQGRYSRSRRYWVVMRFNPNPVDPSDPISRLIGNEPVESLGHFKTGTLAAIAAKKYAAEIGGKLSSYAESFLGKAGQ